MKKYAYSFTFKLLTSFVTYILAVIVFASGTALAVGFREGILTSDQYFNSQSYRRQVEMDMASLIQAASKGTDAWQDVNLPENLKCILVKDNQIVYSNITDTEVNSSVDSAVAYLEAISASKEIVHSSDYYSEALTVHIISIEYYATVDKDLLSTDIYKTAARQYGLIKPYMKIALKFIIPVILLLLLLLSFLVRTTGHVKGQTEIKPSFIDRWYSDVFTAASVIAVVLLSSASWMYTFSWVYETQFDPIYSLLLFSIYCLPIYLISLIWLLSMCRRFQLGTLWRNTLLSLAWPPIFHLLQRGAGFLRRIVQNINLTVSVIIRFLCYLITNIILVAIAWENPPFALMVFGFNLLILLYLCNMAVHFGKIAQTAGAIAAGVLNAKTDVQNMGGPLRQHAEVINKIGDGLNLEVAERVKSDKFKTELIANVSHDIKTPLTALINYVDLLKKQELHHEKAAEYLDVLERNAQRLKDLTNDLVDFSKFSTGSVHLQIERLNIGELIRQGVGEYSEKISTKGLYLVVNLPDEPVYIEADGRHLWRILENLLSNIRKYALPQSRVYIDLSVDQGQAVWTQKNISDHQLNISTEELMERFVRGDSSRHTEGSGLGLSIAKSLTELQGGTFNIEIDGDLFKTTIRFPIV
ncbi:MAG: HAMP domain-containing sensor histidine kinase [Clostridiaceae bacterium]|nr:HAMP domain-containing sensor histidine kinase [Clostridiaceae bacterium]